MKTTEDQLRAIIDTIPVLAWSADPDGSADFFNQRWLEYAGLSVEEARGWGWMAAVHADDLDRITDCCKSIVAAGEPGEIEARLRRADGEYRWFLFRANPFRDESGNIVKWFGTNTDIEDRKRAEDALRVSELTSRLIVDCIPGLVCTLSADGEVQFLNRQVLEYFGKTTEDLKSWATSDAVHPDDLPRAIDGWRRSIESGQPYVLELRQRRADGEYRWFQSVALPARDPEGLITAWYMLLTDIDDRKRAEVDLRATERDLRLIFDSVPGFVWTMSATGEVELVNPQMLAYFGMTLDALKEWPQFIHPDDRERVVALWRRTIEAGQPYDVEHRLRRADGIYRWFHVRGCTQMDAEGHVIRWYNLVTDIDERKRAEAELQTIVDAIPQLIIAIDADGDLQFANQAVLEYTGLTKEEIGSERFRHVFHPEDSQRLHAQREAAISRGVPFEYERRLRHKDGEYRWLLVQYKPLVDERGKVIRWYATGTDIDERKRAEEKLRLSEWNLLEAERLGHLGGWRIDVASQTVTCTPELVRLVGIQPDEDYSNPKFWIDRIHPEDRQRIRERRQLSLSEKIDYEADYRMLLPDGTIKYIHSIGYPVLSETGELLEFIGTVIDTTEQVQARIALENALTEVKRLKDELYQENLALKEEVDQVSMFEEIVGSSQPLQKVLAQVAKVAPTDSTVLILGETGTGKELIARAIHKRSKRSHAPFIRVNCAAIPQSLIASELFGHERGAFTGAVDRRIGRLEAANRGTLFLDEVGELPMETQLSLLRVLQEQELERVGSSQPVPIDVRVVAATNRDLETAMANGTFRRDLYFRLNVFPLHIPSLRERSADIPMLVEYLIERYSKKAGKRFDSIRKKTQEQLQAYDWPGNIRELQNVIERAVVLLDGGTFSIDETWLKRSLPSSGSAAVPLDVGLIERETEMIEVALRDSNGRVSGPSGAANKLGIPRQTLDSRILSLKIDKRRFRTSNSK